MVQPSTAGAGGDRVSSPLLSDLQLFLVVSPFCLPASLTPFRFLFFFGSRESFSRSSRTVLPSLDVHFESYFPVLFLLSSAGERGNLPSSGSVAFPPAAVPGPCLLFSPASCRAHGDATTSLDADSRSDRWSPERRRSKPRRDALSRALVAGCTKCGQTSLKKKKCPHAGGCHLCLDPLTRKEAKHKKTKIANRALSPYCTLSFRTPVLSPLAVGVYPVPGPVSYRFQKICCFFLKKSKARVGVKLENPLLSRTQNEGRMLFSVYLNSVAPRSPPESTRGGGEERTGEKEKEEKKNSS